MARARYSHATWLFLRLRRASNALGKSMRTFRHGGSSPREKDDPIGPWLILIRPAELQQVMDRGPDVVRKNRLRPDEHHPRVLRSILQPSPEERRNGVNVICHEYPFLFSGAHENGLIRGVEKSPAPP